jgi:hypothetical protein
MRIISKIAPLLLVALVAVACEEDGPTVPGDGLQLGVSCEKHPDHPQCTGGGGGGDGGGAKRAEITLCAKVPVVDEINSIDEATDPGTVINSTDSRCEYADIPETDEDPRPRGTLKYSTEGPEFEWTFKGEGFVETVHKYVLIIYPDPWPGRGLICLDQSDGANVGGRLHLSGRQDLGMDLTDAKIWIVRAGWVDCDGASEFNSCTPYGDNPDDVPRLTNDAFDPSQTCTDIDEDFVNSGGPDAAYAPVWRRLGYDWAFENALINYTDTGD